VGVTHMHERHCITLWVTAVPGYQSSCLQS
jgi:hypothetical protein